MIYSNLDKKVEQAIYRKLISLKEKKDSETPANKRKVKNIEKNSFRI